MSVTVTMPALGESVTEGTVTRWLKAVGDTVVADEPLLEVSTDKVDTEIPAPASGVLLSITVGEDATVEVGAELGVIGTSDEAPAAAAPAAPAAPVAEAPPAPRPSSRRPWPRLPRSRPRRPAGGVTTGAGCDRSCRFEHAGADAGAGRERHHLYLGSRHTFAPVDLGRDAAAVVNNRGRAVGVERHLNLVAIAGKRLVDGVVDHLIDHVVEARPVVGVADIHAWPLAHRIEAFQHFDRTLRRSPRLRLLSSLRLVS